MPYALHFRAPTLLSAEALRDYVSDRPCFEVTPSQARYDNPSTGVCFVFDIAPGRGVSFTLDDDRPSFFGREAEPEVASLVAHFGLEIEETRTGSSGTRPYERRAFLQGWKAANRRAVSATARSGSARLSLPQAANTGVWRWNRMREAYLEVLGDAQLEPTFVPTVIILAPTLDPAAAHTAVVWVASMAFVLPSVDRILLPQEDGPTLTVPYAEAAGLLESLPRRSAEHTFELEGRTWRCGLAHQVIDDPITNGALFDLLTKRAEPVSALTRCSPGQVLDREALEDGIERSGA